LEQIRLETAALVLRPLRLSDVAATYAMSNEPAFRQWLPSQVYADEAETQEALEFLIEQYTAPADPRLGPYVLAAEHKLDGCLIGHVGLSPFEGDVEVGFAIAGAYQRQGLATEGVIATCHWAFERFGLSRILAVAAQSNQGSRRVLERAGFLHQRDRVILFQGTEQPVSVYCLGGLEPPTADESSAWR